MKNSLLCIEDLKPYNSVKIIQTCREWNNIEYEYYIYIMYTKF